MGGYKREMDKEIISLIITAILAPILTYAGTKYVDAKSKKSSIAPLTQHPFFERMKCLRNNVQYSFKLQNKGKEAVFRDILTHKFNIFIESMWRLCEDLEKINWDLDSSTFYIKVMDSFRGSVKQYSEYYKNGGYTEDELKCLEIVLKKFNRWHYPRVDNVESSIEIIANSSFYDSNKVRMVSILDMLLGQFVDTLNDAEKTLNELNGDLKGLTFKGIKL